MKFNSMKNIAISLLVFLFSTLSWGQNPINEEKLNALIEEGIQSNSTSIIIYKDGEILKEWYDPEFKSDPRHLASMSVSKSVAVLAIAKLLDMGLIDSVDQPLYTLYPEWKQGQKKTN